MGSHAEGCGGDDEPVIYLRQAESRHLARQSPPSALAQAAHSHMTGRWEEENERGIQGRGERCRHSNKADGPATRKASIPITRLAELTVQVAENNR